MSFITQFKIEFLLPFNGCRKVLGKMPAPHTQAHSFLMISGGIDVINLLKFCYILQAKFGGDPFTQHLYQRQSTIKGIGPQAKSAYSSTDTTQIYEVMFNFQIYHI